MPRSGWEWDGWFDEIWIECVQWMIVVCAMVMDEVELLRVHLMWHLSTVCTAYPVCVCLCAYSKCSQYMCFMSNEIHINNILARRVNIVRISTAISKPSQTNWPNEESEPKPTSNTGNDGLLHTETAAAVATAPPTTTTRTWNKNVMQCIFCGPCIRNPVLVVRWCTDLNLFRWDRSRPVHQYTLLLFGLFHSFLSHIYLIFASFFAVALPIFPSFIIIILLPWRV